MADISRVYEVQVQGLQSSIDKMSEFNKSIELTDNKIKQLNQSLAGAQNAGDSKQIEDLNKQIAELKKQLDFLVRSKEANLRETTANTQAEKNFQIQSEVNSKSIASLTNSQKENTKASEDQTKANDSEEESYKTLSERIRQLRTLREEAITTGKPIEFEGVNLTNDQALTQIQRLLTLQNQIKQEEQTTLEIQKSKNINAQQGISLLEQERRELQQILSATAQGNDIAFRGRILSYGEANVRLNELIQTEQNYRQKEIDLNTEIDVVTKSIEDQIQRRNDLNAAIAKGTQGQVQPLSPNLGVNFEGNNISLKEARELNNEITADLGKQNVELLNLKQQRAQLNQIQSTEAATIKTNLIVEEGSLNDLIAKRKELNTLIGNRAPDSKSSIIFNNEVLSIQQAIDKRKELDAQIDVGKGKVVVETETLQKEVSEYQQLIARRKELIDLTNSASISNKNSLEFNGVTISIQEAIDRVQTMNVRVQELNDRFKVQKGIHDQINIAEETSINKIKEEAALLSTVLKNREAGANSVSFNGNNISISQAQSQLASYQATIQEYNNQERLRKQAVDLVNNSMKQLEIETKSLTQANVQLTASNKDQGLNLNQSQYQSIISSISTLVPELNGLTLAEVNQGKASDILTKKIYENNAALREFKRDMSGSNTIVGDYTKGIVDAFKNLGLGNEIAKQKEDVNNQIKQILIRITQLNNEWGATGKSGAQSLDKIENELKELGAQYSKLTAQAKTFDDALESTQGIGNQVTNGIANGFKNVESSISRTLFTYVGFQAALSGVTRLINIDKTLTDQFADLQRVLGATRDETNKVVESLKTLDTRTSLTALQGFAVIAARAGVAAEQIAGVTSAINKLQLTAGSELGNIDEATTSIVKLINIFQGAGAVTEEAVLRTGNALLQLSNQGVASGAFLVNFSERLAGIRGATGIAQEAVLGLAAAFEETGQTSEVSASAVSQVINRVSQDIPRYASIAGKATEEFRKVFRENPAEALIQLAEGLRENGKAADELGVEYDKLGLSGIRIRNTLQDVGANSEFFRKRISDATEALLNQNAILDGAANKQQTFAATVEKTGAELVKAADNQNFINLLNSAANLLLGIVRLAGQIPFSIIIAGISGITGALALFKGQAIASALAQAALNKESAFNGVAMFAERIGLIQVTAAQRLKAAANAYEVEQLRLATIARIRATAATEAEAVAAIEAAGATTALNTALRVSPLGIFLALIGVALPLIGAFASKIDDSTDSINKQSTSLKRSTDIQKDLQASIVEQTSKTEQQIKNLIAVIKDENLNMSVRADAYRKLIQLQPEFTGTVQITTDALGNEKIQILDLMTVYDQFIAKIHEVAKAKALQTLDVKAQDELQAANLKVFQAEADKIAEDAKNAEIRRNNAAIQTQGAQTPSTSTALSGVNVTASQKQKESNEAAQRLIQANAEQAEALKKANQTSEFVKVQVDGYNSKLKEINDKLKDGNLSTEERQKLIEQRNFTQSLINSGLGIADQGQTKDLQYYINQYNSLSDQIAAIVKNNAKLKEGSVQYAEQDKLLKDLRKQQTETAKRIKELGGEVPGSKTSTRVGSTGRLQEERDVLNEIETLRNRDVANENLRVAQINSVRKLTEYETEEHLRTLQEINDKYDQLKIFRLQDVLDRTIKMQETASGKLLDKLKSDQIREEKELSEARLAMANRANQTNEQILAVRQKALDDQIRIEKKDLDARKSQLQQEYESIASIPNQSNTVIAEANKKLHQDILTETVEHYNRLIDMAKRFGLSTELLEDEKNKAISDALRLSLKDNRDIYDAYFKDVEKNINNNILNIRDKLNTIRENILDSNENNNVKNIKLGTIDNAENVLTATEKLKGAQDEYNKALKDYQKITDDIRNTDTDIFITDEQLNKLHDAVVKAKEDLKSALDELNSNLNNYGSFSGVLTSAIGNIFKGAFKVSAEDVTKANESGDFSDIDKKTQNAQMLGAAISSAYDTAKQALNDFYDAEQERIEHSKQVNEDRLKLETDQQKARAQSQAERDTLDRQYAEKKKQIDKKAFEDNKKLQKEQALINLGSELAYIALTAAIVGSASFGVGGIIYEIVQAALAVARYASNVSKINSAQFSGEYGMHISNKYNYGGSPDTTTIRGGKVKGRSHSTGGNPFVFKGRIFEDEIDELNVIRTKNAPKNQKYRVEGTQSQIASFLNQIGGGIAFDFGAIGSRLEFGGNVTNINQFESGGSILSLNAPTNTSSLLNGSANNINMKAIVTQVYDDMSKMSKKIDEQTDNINNFAVATHERIDNIKVFVVANEVESTNKDLKKASSVGTLVNNKK